MAGSAEAKRKWREKHPNYARQWREKNRDKKCQADREYYALNKAQISEKKKQAYKNNENLRQQYKDRQRAKYKENPMIILAANDRRRRAQREKIVAIALYYGCQNSMCAWGMEFIPSQLDFHHLDGEKKYNVSQMTNHCDKKIAEEINKCCVLCKCCHAAVTVGHIVYDGDRCLVDEHLQIRIRAQQ